MNKGSFEIINNKLKTPHLQLTTAAEKPVILTAAGNFFRLNASYGDEWFVTS